MNDKNLSVNERDAVLRVLQTATENGLVRAEDRAALVRAMKKLTALEIKRKFPPTHKERTFD